MRLRRRVIALVAGGWLLSCAGADAQQPERGQGPAPSPAADVARVMTDVKYGPHPRNLMDVWLARADKPTPVLVSIHGGAFRNGTKSVEPALRDRCLAAGISVVAITYRLSQDAIAPAAFHDSARAIQFIRHNATEWNLDPQRIAATGGSAGAGLALWLGFRDDLADPGNPDPVLRQSSRLSGMVVNDGQSSYDPRVIRDLFRGTDTYKHPALAQLYDVDLDQLDKLTKEKYKLFEDVSPINHLTKDDPPARLSYGIPLNTQVTDLQIGAHHPKFGVMLKAKMDALGIRCELYVSGEKIGGGNTTLPFEFLKQVLGVR